jgi:hypothetical protein
VFAVSDDRILAGRKQAEHWLLMKVTWPIAVLTPLTLAGCGPIAEGFIAKIRADAVAAVSTQIDRSVSGANALRVDANPWGSGFLVYRADPAGSEQVCVWLYYPNLSWTIPRSPKRDELFAFESGASKLTPRVPLFGMADEHVRRESGMAALPPDVVHETIVRAIRQGITVHEARALLSRDSETVKYR